ncbi:hypothetical protein CEW91_06735 [Idiomarina piscisalsi]|uniref:Primase C-terminal 1 domain-containing protein n=1 Tax=Idiomarina piscisalsi TaxID=1096243 RepID=A0ABM6LTV5_9GAMM|nr:hypothetical protein [Idiomarina piscisalsi]ASG65850.1 hypothetical protein CEW91_06735 [Idiomarina piscisalsi]
MRINSTFSEVSLPDFFSSVVGYETKAHRDVRSLYADKLKKHVEKEISFKVKNSTLFGSVNSKNIRSLTKKSFREAVYGNLDVEDDDFLGEEVFFTPNGFFSAPISRIARLSELCCVWVDLDVRDKKLERRLTLIETARIHNSLYTALGRDENIPEPDLTVESGSGGLHFYWLFKTEEATSKNVKLWFMLKERLNSLFFALCIDRELFVDDKANKSPRGVMRLPGTINIKYHTACKAYRNNKRRERRTLGSLIAQLGIKDTQKTVPRVYNKNFKPSLISSEDFCRNYFHVPESLSNHQKWCLKYANFVIPILLKGKRVKVGFRDLVAYSVVVCLKQLACPRNLIKELIIKINRSSIKLPPGTLLNYMSTVMIKRYQASSGEFIKNFTKGTGVSTGHLVKKRKPSKRNRAEHARYVSKKIRKESMHKVVEAISSIQKQGIPVHKVRLKNVSEASGLANQTLRNLGLKKSNIWVWYLICNPSTKAHKVCDIEITVMKSGYYRIRQISNAKT